MVIEPTTYFSPSHQNLHLKDTAMWYRVTAVRSTIGMPKTIRETFTALGLKRRGAVVYQPVNSKSAGQLLKVKELIKVQLVDKKLEKAEEAALRKPKAGYSVVKEAQ